MDNIERIKTILKHCIKEECYACPLKGNRECVRSMAFTANQTILSLGKHIEKLENRNAELEAQLEECKHGNLGECE